MKKSFMNNIKNFVDSNVRQRIDRAAAQHHSEPFSDDVLAAERHFEDIRQVCLDADKKISALLQSIHLSSNSTHLGSYTKNVQAGLNNLSHSLQAASIATSSTGSNNNIATLTSTNVKSNDNTCKNSQQSVTNGEMFTPGNSTMQYRSSESLSNSSNTMTKSRDSVISHPMAESNCQLSGQLSSDVQERYKKLPVVGFYKFLIKSSQKMQPDSLLAVALTQCSQIQIQLTNLYLNYEKSVETQCLKPIQNMIETDIPNVIKLRKLYIKSHNDYEFLKTRYIGASHKQQQQQQQQSQLSGQSGNCTNTSYLVSQSSILQASTNKLDQLKNELEEAITRSEQARHNYEAELYGFVCRETELVNLLRTFYQYQTEYHLQVGTILQGLKPTLCESLAVTPRKSAFGTHLNEHLRCTGREISPVIELCIHFLHSQGLKEEGLFRISGSSTKIKKLKNGINAWFLSLASLEELESDQTKQSGHHCIKALYHLFEDATGQRICQTELPHQVSTTLASSVLRSTLALDEASFNQMNVPHVTHVNETPQLDVHSLSGLLKLYLRELPEPLCTFALYEDWIRCVDNRYDSSHRLELISAVIDRLPATNRANLTHLVKFLHVLTEHEGINKMTSTNLAIAMAPSLFWSKPVQNSDQDDSSVADVESLNMQMSTFGISASHHALILEALINNADTLFPESSDFGLPGFENLSRPCKGSSQRSRSVKSTSPTGLSTTSSSSFSSNASNSTSSSSSVKCHSRKGGSMEGLLSSQGVATLLQSQSTPTRSAARPVSVQIQRDEYTSDARQHRKLPTKPPVPVLRSQHRQSVYLEQNLNASQKPPAPPVPPPTSARHQLERLKAANSLASKSSQSSEKPRPTSLRGTGTIEQNCTSAVAGANNHHVTRPTVPPPARPDSTSNEPDKVAFNPIIAPCSVEGSDKGSNVMPSNLDAATSSVSVDNDASKISGTPPTVSLDSMSEEEEEGTCSAENNSGRNCVEQSNSLSDEPSPEPGLPANSQPAPSGSQENACISEPAAKHDTEERKSQAEINDHPQPVPPVKPPRTLSPKITQSTPL